MNFISFIQKPYPITINKWPSISIISLFIFLFIYIFKPFGLHYYSTNLIYIALGYGAVSFICLILNLIVLPLVFAKIFAEENWNIGKQILWLLWIVTSIALGNVLYSVSANIISWTGIRDIFVFEGYTIAVAILPIIAYTLIAQNEYLKTNMATSLKLNNLIKEQVANSKPQTTLTLGTDTFYLQNILYIESEGNYVHVFYVNNNKLESKLVRSTLKSIEENVQNYTELFRCHRAYIVNLNSILQVNGNAQGLKLSLKSSSFKVPVSRTFLQKFREVFV